MPVDVGLGPEAADQVRYDVLEQEFLPVPRAHGSLAPEIDDVRDLRISKALAGGLPAAGPHVDAGQPACAQQGASPTELVREIHVFLPAIERQLLVEPEALGRRGAERHVAAAQLQAGLGSVSRAFAAQVEPPRGFRSAQRRVGKECCSTWRSGWSPSYFKKNN